jgi:hypothetical protein
VVHWRRISASGRGSIIVGSDTGELVGRDVAHAVAGGLDGVHLDVGQFGQDLGHILDLRPVQLQVVARREMAVAAVVLAGDVTQLAQLGGTQHAVGHGDAEHRRMALDIQAILQAQRAELVVGQFARFPAADLIAELGDALVDQLAVDSIVFVHETSLGKNQLGADQHQHGGQNAAQDVLRHFGGNLGAQPDAGQRTDQQAAEQRPVDPPSIQ